MLQLIKTNKHLHFYWFYVRSSQHLHRVCDNRNSLPLNHRLIYTFNLRFVSQSIRKGQAINSATTKTTFKNYFCQFKVVFVCRQSERMNFWVVKSCEKSGAFKGFNFPTFSVTQSIVNVVVSRQLNELKPSSIHG